MYKKYIQYKTNPKKTKIQIKKNTKHTESNTFSFQTVQNKNKKTRQNAKSQKSLRNS